MADDARPRPVSGEIMTGGRAPPAAFAVRPAGSDIVDAEFETLEAVVKSQHGIPANGIAPVAPVVPPAGMDMLRKMPGQTRRAAAARGGPLFWAFGLGLAIAAFWVSGGHTVMRAGLLSGTQAPLRALRISSVSSRVDLSGAHPVLFVDGEAANDGAVVETLQPLDIVVTGNDDRITRYRLGTSGRRMPPGEVFVFSSRLDVPMNGVKTVSVAFGE